MSTHRIKEIREGLNYTRKKISGHEAAKWLDISPQYYYDIEKGKRTLSAENASILADRFGVSVDYLLGRSDEPAVQKNSSLVQEESVSYEFDLLAIEDLVKHNLTYKGKKLSSEQKEHLAKLVQAAADLLK